LCSETGILLRQCYDFSRWVSYTTVTEDPSMTEGRRGK